MKRMNRLLIVTVLLGQIAGMTIPSAYAVTTVTSSNKETVAPSTEQTTASTTLQEQKSAEEKQLEPAPVRQPTYSTEEKTYDERKLTKVEELDEENQEPQIIFQKEIVDQAIALKGELIARESKPDENKSETKLTQLILQSRKEGGKWETARAMELPENKPILLNKEAFKFEFQQQPEEAGSYDYRLAVDYEQSEFEGEQLSKVVTHKASYEVGTITIEEKQPETSSSSTEESSVTEESQSTETTETTSTEESSNTEESSSEAITSQEEIEQTTTESSETNDESTDETTKQSDEDSKSKEDEVPPLDLAEANKDLPVLPLMKVTKKQHEKEAARNNLMKPTWAVATDDIYEWGNAVRTYEADTRIGVFDITKTSASLGGEYYNNFDLYQNQPPILVWSDNLSDVTANTITYDYSKWGATDGTDTSELGSKKDQVYDYNGKPKVVTTDGGWVDFDKPKKGIYFKNWDTDSTTNWSTKNPFVGLKPGTKYYFNWYYAETMSEYKRVTFDDGEENTNGEGSSTAYHFKTKDAEPLKIGKPVFGDATDSSLKMLNTSDNTYTGDPATTGESLQGVTEFAKKINGEYEWVGNNNGLNGGGTTSDFADGKYSLGTVTGLEPGTWYQLRLVRRQLHESNDGWGRSENEWAPTKVKANAPNSEWTTYPSTPPTSWTDAKATMEAEYEAGDAGPGSESDFEIQFEGDGGRWDAAPADKIESIVPNYESKKVKFNFHNLGADKWYGVKYRVKNTAGWSEWSDPTWFKTKAVPLWIETPKFGNATDASLEMLPKVAGANGGQYNYWGSPLYGGEVDAGVIDFYKKNSLDQDAEYIWTGNNKGIVGTGTLSYFHNGTYSLGKISSGLEPGTWYKLLVGREQTYDRAWVYSDAAFAPTKVRVNAPNDNWTSYPSELPQNENDERVTVRANYDAFDAKALEFKTRIKVEGGSWQDVDNTPQLDGYTHDTDGKVVGIHLKNLVTKKKYEIQYMARNEAGWSDWSETGEVRTRGVQLRVSQPAFYQDRATPTTVQMKQGTYTGDTYTGSDPNKKAELSLTSWLNEHTYTNERFELSYSNGVYNSDQRTFENLEPGTHYRVYANIPNYEGGVSSGRGEGNDYDGGDFVTPTIVTSAGSVSHTSTGYDSASVTVSGTYLVGTNPAHPRNGDDFSIKYRKIGNLNWIDIDENSTNLVGDPTIDTQGKRVSFTLGGLLEGTEYEVQYSVKNASEVWSNVIEERFETDQRPDGLYIGTDHLSGFHFSNTLTTSPNTQSIGLAAPLIGSTNQPAWINIDNIGVENNWKMGATLSKITKVGDESVELTGAELTIGKSLEKRDSSGDWGTVSSSDPIDGLAETSATFVQEEPQILWESTNVAYGKGYFRHMIDHDSVQLMIPGSSGRLRTQYEGEVTWTLSNAL